MKKIMFIITALVLAIVPLKAEAKIENLVSCDEVKSDWSENRQIKTCYIDIQVSGSDRFYSVSGAFKMVNTSLKGEITSVDKRIKITNSNLDNLTFTSETPIQNEKIRIAKFTLYLATNGHDCSVTWEPKVYGRNYTCQIENGYYYDKNGNSVSKEEYSKQCEKHTCEIIGDTYFDKNGNSVSKEEYSKQCEKHTCEIIGDTYFDKNGNSVSKEEYSKQCEKHTCEIIGDTYFDKSGNSVSKEEYSKQCEKHTCEIIGDTYFDKNGNSVSKEEYSKQCEKHTCEIIGGVYFDKNGNSVSDVEYDKQCNKHYCKIIDNTYFGKNGDIISKEKYDIECPSSNPHTAKVDPLVLIFVGLLTLTAGTILINLKQNKKTYKI